MGARERSPSERPRPHPEVDHRGLPGRELTAGQDESGGGCSPHLPRSSPMQSYDEDCPSCALLSVKSMRDVISYPAA
jgi:hypothetical protein